MQWHAFVDTVMNLRIAQSMVTVNCLELLRTKFRQNQLTDGLVHV